MHRFLFLLWGLSISAGALWIRFGAPQRDLPLLARAIGSEPVHVVAHSVLYGTLAWLCSRRMPLRWVVPTVLALGFVQELAQVLGERPFGRPELFDLTVDGAAALLVVAALRAFAARPARVLPAPPNR